MTRRFLLIAFGWSWTVAAILYFTGGLEGIRHTVGGFAFMLGPAIAALACTRDPKALGLALPFNRWLPIAWAIPVSALVLATWGSSLLPGTHLINPVDALAAYLPPDRAQKLAVLPRAPLTVGLLVQAFVLGPVLNVPFMLSEELGWRGALWSQWSRLSFWRNAGLTGAVWGIWHAPLILMGHNYPDTPKLGVLLMVVFCMLLAPLIHHVRERGGTVWHACLFHGTINAGASLTAICLQTSGWVGRGIVGLAGFVVLGAMVLTLWLVRR